MDLLADDPAATTFAATLAEPVAISAVSFYELLFGATGRRRIAQVDGLARDYAVLPADYEVYAMAASIQSWLGDAGQLIPVLDAIIASTEVLADLPLVIADEHFARIPSDFGLVVRGY